MQDAITATEDASAIAAAAAAVVVAAAAAAAAVRVANDATDTDAAAEMVVVAVAEVADVISYNKEQRFCQRNINFVGSKICFESCLLNNIFHQYLYARK